MNTRMTLRTAAAAAAIGVMVLGSPAGQALAAPKSSAQLRCETRGFDWDPDRGCGDKLCGGGLYMPGEIVVRRFFGMGSGKADTITLQCNGWTGKMERVL